MKRLTKRWGEKPYPNLAGKVVCEYKECDSAKSCNDCVHWRIAQRLAAIEDILCDGTDDYDLDRLAAVYNQRVSMRDEVSQRFSLTAKIPLDHLRELAEADREGRCVVLDDLTVADLQQMLTVLDSTHYGDGAETYTTGYRNGHRNGRIEILRYVLGIYEGDSTEAEAAISTT